jgi:tetratricopeptide (TPR) repeat protein
MTGPYATVAAARPHRYPGPPPFEDTAEDRQRFFGRRDEIDAIVETTIASRLLVVFGKSGLGKTSLLNAGVFPRLREGEFLPVRVRLRRGVDPVRLVRDAVAAAAERSATDCSLAEAETLWELFKRSTVWRDETLLTPVVLFDQFEEAFTELPRDERLALADEIGPLASGAMPEALRRRERGADPGARMSDAPPEVRIILSLREEYLASLQELSARVPRLFQNRFRIAALTDAQAVEAIREPARLGAGPFATEPFEYEPEALQLMLEFLRGRSGRIEPWALQLLCSHVERHVVPAIAAGLADAAAGVRVGPLDLGGTDTMGRVLGAFYETELSAIAGPQGRCARRLCDSGLVDGQGRRRSLDADEILADWRVTPATLELLVAARVLRREPRLDSVYYEISHDTLAATILATRPWRLPRRLRAPAWVAGVVVLAGVTAAAAGHVGIRRQRDAADAARARSEELVAFLIGEDLVDGLRRTGKLAMATEVQAQVEKYLAKAGSGSPSPATELAAALAALNRGELARTRGRLERARASHAEAVEGFRRLVARSPADADARQGLARALTGAAAVARDQGRLAEAVRLAEDAVGAFRQLPREHALRPRAARHRASAHVALASYLLQQGRPGAAELHVEEAFRSLAIASAEERASPEWRSTSTEAHDVRALVAQWRHDHAVAEAMLLELQRVGRELAQDEPFDPTARKLGAMASYRLAELEPALAREAADEERPADLAGAAQAPPGAGARAGTGRAAEDRVTVYRQLVDTFDRLVRWEPGNAMLRREHAAARVVLGAGQRAAGRPEVAVHELERARHALEELARADDTNAQLRSDQVWVRTELADAESDPAAALAHVEAGLATASLVAEAPGTDRDLLHRRVALLVRRGRLLHRLGRSPEATAAIGGAIDALEAIPHVDPADGRHHVLLRAAYQQLALASDADPAAARRAYRAAVDAVERALSAGLASPHFVAERSRALRDLARHELRAGELEAARSHLAAAVEALRDAIATARRTDRKAYAGELVAAVSDDVVPAWMAAGDVAAAAAAHRDAEATIRREIERHPGEHGLYWRLASACRRAGDFHRDRRPPDVAAAERAYAEAEAALRERIALGESARTWNQLSLLELDGRAPLRGARGDRAGELRAYRRAAAAIARAVELAPDEPAYRSRQAEAELRLAALSRRPARARAWGERRAAR